MYEELAIFELSIWLGLPAWIANSMPVIFGGGMPIDQGYRFRDGRRLFGDGKTIKGFIVGVLCGTLVGLVQIIAAPSLRPVLGQYVTITPDMDVILLMGLPSVFLLSLGALVGDLIGSFLKRRIDILSGNPSPVLDQLGFIIMGLIIASPILQPAPQYVTILVLTTLFIHWISNALGYILGLKKNPW
jgi:CDP-2,3-bis-(O-geranylgeranyl)-sn-glycerol synthase